MSPQKQSLILIPDDANNDIYYAKLVPEETTRECMLGLYHVVVTKGVFCSLYSDQAGHSSIPQKQEAKLIWLI